MRCCASGSHARPGHPESAVRCSAAISITLLARGLVGGHEHTARYRVSSTRAEVVVFDEWGSEKETGVERRDASRLADCVHEVAGIRYPIQQAGMGAVASPSRRGGHGRGGLGMLSGEGLRSVPSMRPVLQAHSRRVPSTSSSPSWATRRPWNLPRDRAKVVEFFYGTPSRQLVCRVHDAGPWPPGRGDRRGGEGVLPRQGRVRPSGPGHRGGRHLRGRNRPRGLAARSAGVRGDPCSRRAGSIGAGLAWPPSPRAQRGSASAPRLRPAGSRPGSPSRCYVPDRAEAAAGGHVVTDSSRELARCSIGG